MTDTYMLVNSVRLSLCHLVGTIRVPLADVIPHNYHRCREKAQISDVVRVSVSAHHPVYVPRLQAPVLQRRLEEVPVPRSTGVHQNNLGSRYERDGPVRPERPVGLRDAVSDFEDRHAVRHAGEVQFRLCNGDCSTWTFAVCLHHEESSHGVSLVVEVQLHCSVQTRRYFIVAYCHLVHGRVSCSETGNKSAI